MHTRSIAITQTRYFRINSNKNWIIRFVMVKEKFGAAYKTIVGKAANQEKHLMLLGFNPPDQPLKKETELSGESSSSHLLKQQFIL